MDCPLTSTIYLISSYQIFPSYLGELLPSHFTTILAKALAIDCSFCLPRLRRPTRNTLAISYTRQYSTLNTSLPRTDAHICTYVCMRIWYIRTVRTYVAQHGMVHLRIAPNGLRMHALGCDARGQPDRKRFARGTRYT